MKLNEQLTVTCKAHHWLIDYNNIGYCKNCGERHNFTEANRKLDPVYYRKIYVDHLGGVQYYMQGSLPTDIPVYPVYKT